MINQIDHINHMVYKDYQSNSRLSEIITIIFLLIVSITANSQALIEKGNLELDTIISHLSDDWKLLEYKPSDSEEVWFFRKNLAAKVLLGHESLSTLVYYTVKFAPKDASGLPTASDAAHLYVFEENIIPLVEKATSSLLVASVLKAGVKDHLFYVSNPDLFLEVISEYKPALSSFSISEEVSFDPNWEAYTDFPDGT